MSVDHKEKALTWINRPVPYPDESLAGFVGRWARENVFSSRVDLLNAIRVSRAIRIFPADLEKLAASLGVDIPVLEAIAPSSDPARPVLRRSYTRADGEAVCPHCLSEASYSRQLWSHCLATACPTHGSRLIDHCQRCHKGIRHDRPLSHLCDWVQICGCSPLFPRVRLRLSFPGSWWGGDPKSKPFHSSSNSDFQWSLTFIFGA